MDDEDEYISRRELEARMPNLYGNPEAEDVQGVSNLHSTFSALNPIQYPSSNPPSHAPAFGTLQRCSNGGTLLRLHRTPSHRSISIPVSIPSTPQILSKGPKSPTPSAFSVYTNNTGSPPQHEGRAENGTPRTMNRANPHSPDSNTATTTTNSSVNGNVNGKPPPAPASSTFKPPANQSLFTYSTNSLDHPMGSHALSLSRDHLNHLQHPTTYQNPMVQNGFGTLSRRTAHLNGGTAIGSMGGYGDLDQTRTEEMMSRSMSRFHKENGIALR